MKRILQISASLQIGGAEKVVRDIGFYADPKEYEIHYIVFTDAIGEYEQELTEHGCMIYHWPSPSESYPAYFRALLDLMRTNRYYAVHAHTMFSIGWAMLAARLCGVPVRVAHAHSALNNGKSIKKHVYEKTMRQVILRTATALVACGNAAGIRLYGKNAYEKRGICILNGIDTAAFSYNPEARAKIRKELALDDSYVIGHVGHLVKVKNQSFLIRLMPQILKRKPNAKLLMLGEGDDRPMLERLIEEQGLTEYVIMTGNVRNVPDFLSAMDVFAFPSLFEGMPLSIIEIQANGLPCILSTGVPRDVYLTDLIHPLSLDCVDDWIDQICSLKRGNSSRYADLLKEAGFDKDSAMKAIMNLYHQNKTNQETDSMGFSIKSALPAVVSAWSNSVIFKKIDRFISLQAQKKLHNDQFTILCSNCIGGVIYHRLGKQFLSPTVNMFIKEPDFVEFCLHLDYYLSQELRFLDSELPHPVGVLSGDGDRIPDITLYFNHDVYPETAKANWDRRKKRINRNNLYIILYNLSGVTETQLRTLEGVPCKNKVVLTAEPLPDIPWSFYIRSHKPDDNYLEKDIFGVRYFEKKFNYIEFLNQ